MLFDEINTLPEKEQKECKKRYLQDFLKRDDVLDTELDEMYNFLTDHQAKTNSITDKLAYIRNEITLLSPIALIPLLGRVTQKKWDSANTAQQALLAKIKKQNTQVYTLEGNRLIINPNFNLANSLEDDSAHMPNSVPKNLIEMLAMIELSYQYDRIKHEQDTQSIKLAIERNDFEAAFADIDKYFKTSNKIIDYQWYDLGKMIIAQLKTLFESSVQDHPTNVKYLAKLLGLSPECKYLGDKYLLMYMKENNQKYCTLNWFNIERLLFKVLIKNNILAKEELTPPPVNEVNLTAITINNNLTETNEQGFNPLYLAYLSDNYQAASVYLKAMAKLDKQQQVRILEIFEPNQYSHIMLWLNQYNLVSMLLDILVGENEKALPNLAKSIFYTTEEHLITNVVRMKNQAAQQSMVLKEYTNRQNLLSRAFVLKSWNANILLLQVQDFDKHTIGNILADTDVTGRTCLFYAYNSMPIMLTRMLQLIQQQEYKTQLIAFRSFEVTNNTKLAELRKFVNRIATQQILNLLLDITVGSDDKTFKNIVKYVFEQAARDSVFLLYVLYAIPMMAKKARYEMLCQQHKDKNILMLALSNNTDFCYVISEIFSVIVQLNKEQQKNILVDLTEKNIDKLYKLLCLIDSDDLAFALNILCCVPNFPEKLQEKLTHKLLCFVFDVIEMGDPQASKKLIANVFNIITNDQMQDMHYQDQVAFLRNKRFELSKTAKMLNSLFSTQSSFQAKNHAILEKYLKESQISYRIEDGVVTLNPRYAPIDFPVSENWKEALIAIFNETLSVEADADNKREEKTGSKARIASFSNKLFSEHPENNKYLLDSLKRIYFYLSQALLKDVKQKSIDFLLADPDEVLISFERRVQITAISFAMPHNFSELLCFVDLTIKIKMMQNHPFFSKAGLACMSDYDRFLYLFSQVDLFYPCDDTLKAEAQEKLQWQLMPCFIFIQLKSLLDAMQAKAYIKIYLQRLFDLPEDHDASLFFLGDKINWFYIQALLIQKIIQMNAYNAQQCVRDELGEHALQQLLEDKIDNDNIFKYLCIRIQGFSKDKRSSRFTDLIKEVLNLKNDGFIKQLFDVMTENKYTDELLPVQIEYLKLEIDKLSGDKDAATKQAQILRSDHTPKLSDARDSFFSENSLLEKDEQPEEISALNFQNQL